MKFGNIPSGDLVFAGLMIFGIAACVYGIYRGVCDLDSPWSDFVPAFAGFSVFPLVNALIGVVIGICAIYERLTRTKT